MWIKVQQKLHHLSMCHPWSSERHLKQSKPRILVGANVQVPMKVPLCCFLCMPCALKFHFNTGAGDCSSYRFETEMYMVVLSNYPPEGSVDARWWVTFRSRARARAFGAGFAALLVRFVTRPWCISLYTVDFGSWPDSWDQPLLQWMLAHTN